MVMQTCARRILLPSASIMLVCALVMVGGAAGGQENKASIYLPPAPRVPPAAPILLKPGPHLLVDDLLVESSSNITRKVNMPVRDPAIPNPIVTGKEDGCFQPYMSVVRDPRTRRFRLWYGIRTEDSNQARSHIGYLESEDGIRWIRPHRVLADPSTIQFGVSAIDEGPAFSNPAERFKYAWWHGGGLRIATSPDGLTWTPLSTDVLVAHNHDINGIYWDPLRNRYVATVSFHITGPTWSGTRRITKQSASHDLRRWAEPWVVLAPDDKLDQGETQFYAMDGYLARGDLILGMVKVLRDDLKADQPPDPRDAYGIGYTTLAWTRDGEQWTRDREPFFDRHPQPLCGSRSRRCRRKLQNALGNAARRDDDAEPEGPGRRGMRASTRRSRQTVARLHPKRLPSGLRGCSCGAGAMGEAVERAGRQDGPAGILPEERPAVCF